MISTRTMRRGLLGAVVLLGLVAPPAGAAHNGNNDADLTGDGAVTGHAVVNYAEGRSEVQQRPSFNATATTQGLDPGLHTFRVVLINAVTGVRSNQTDVCVFTTGVGRRGGCSAQNVNLPGFNTAEIVDAGGALEAVGVFARRGNCRDPQQAGTQCEANDTRQNS